MHRLKCGDEPFNCERDRHRTVLFLLLGEAQPGCLCDVLRQRGWPFATIERVVAIPNNFPCLEVFAGDWTNDENCQKMFGTEVVGIRRTRLSSAPPGRNVSKVEIRYRRAVERG